MPACSTRCRPSDCRCASGARWARAGEAVEVDAEAYGDFALVRSYAIDAHRAAHPDDPVRSTVLRDVAGGNGPTRPRPIVACEDWFAGVNPGTARDIAQQFYFAEAAAQLHGLTFRAVANQTWKKTYLGRGNMRSDEALLAYATKGHVAHPHVTRWAGTTVGALGEADDAAALGVAHHWLSTEST